MTMLPQKGSGVRGILDIINPILAGVSLGRGGTWGLAGGIGSLGAQIADALWRQRQTGKKGKKPAKTPVQMSLPQPTAQSMPSLGPPRMST